MDEKNEELVDAQIVEEDSRVYGHAEGEPGGEVADEPALVLGDDDPHDAELHEKILSEECAWKARSSTSTVLRLSCPTVAAAPAISFAIRVLRPLWR